MEINLKTLGRITLFALLFELIFYTVVITFCHAEVYDSEQIAIAIYHAEGGAKAIKPFGILSVKCNDYNECKNICLNTIENNFTRWQINGSKGDFIEFLANRYCPTVGKLNNAEKQLNHHWIKNVKYFLTKQTRSL
jgi:hypothetical protein